MPEWAKLWRKTGQRDLTASYKRLQKDSDRTIIPVVEDSPGGSDDKVSAYNAGDPGSIPGSGRSSGEGNGNPLQYSCLENPMDGGV